MEFLRAFLVGGALCAAAQVLIDRTRLTPARILVGYVVAGVVLGGAGLYDPVVSYAGAGARLPLTGFGYIIAKGVREAIERDGAIGILTGALTASAGGISAALIFGFAAALVFHDKKQK